MKNLNIIVPQYHSSYCVNNCKYCGFRRSNLSINRISLNDEEFKNEMKVLLNWGYRVIEFVYSSDINFSIENVARRIEYTKEYGLKSNLKIKIGLNAEPLNFKEYKTLHYAGLDFFVLWMETYSRDKYQFWHGNDTPKSNFNYRYESYERAIEAGIKKYGMGVLLGLYKWTEDVNELLLHAKKLEMKYKLTPYIIGLPRVKKAQFITNKNFIFVSDLDFIQITKIYKKNFPKSMLFFNTREKPDLNIKCSFNNDIFTIDCRTYPAAYLNPQKMEKGFEQFHTYFYDKKDIYVKFKKSNINPVFEW